MKYRINLIKDILKEEKLEKARSLRIVIYTWVSFALLLFVLFDATLRVMSVNQLIAAEQLKLDIIEEEYRNYQETREVINRMDIELLDKIQGDRIFWTKKLAATALYLPQKYWIEEMKYDGKYYVSGFGYTVPQQKQLITMDNYLNKLRLDTTFNDDFGSVFLNAVVRTDEKRVKKVLFELTADKKMGGAQ